ncbi:hypothetical protein GCM10009660_60370 [Catellatospora bangladeshensis]
MSNEDKRRRRDGSTAQLSVADLIARREAETQPIPRITDEETVRFPAANLSGRELHITELLRREGRAGEEERGGGLSVPKLVAMASGGVVLAGTVAFTATNLLSSPDERPLAEVRFDTRPAARSTNTLGYDLATTMQQQTQQQAPEQAADRTEPAAAGPDTPAQQRPRPTQRPAPVAQQPAPPPAAEPAPTTEQPPSTTTAPPAPPAPAPPAPPSAPPTTTTPPTTQAPPPSSTPVAPPTSDSPPPSSTPALPSVPPLLDPGGVLAPLGGFDFFAPA